MDLKHQSGSQFLIQKTFIHTIHGNFDYICSSSLNWRVHGNTLAKGSLHKIAGFQFRNRPFSAKHSGNIAFFFSLLHKSIQKSLYAWIGLKIFLDISSSLFSCNAKILAKTKRADTIYNTKIHRLGISSLQRSDLLKRNMKDLRRCQSVNIFRLSVSLDQLLIPGHVSKNTQLNL